MVTSGFAFVGALSVQRGRAACVDDDNVDATDSKSARTDERGNRDTRVMTSS
jgi:hypothetical protein